MVKDKFYDELQKICKRVPRHDAIMILGDYNAKLEIEQEFHDVFGKQSLQNETSKNGMRVGLFAISNNMKVMSTCFEHEGNTWEHGKYLEQI